MKQKLTLFSIIMIVIETICLFLPYTFQEELWHYDAYALTYHGKASLEARYNVNILQIYTDMGRILAFIVIAFMVLSFLAYLFSFLQKKNFLTKYDYITPVISLVFLVCLAIYAYAYAEIDSTNWRREWTINWMFYVVIALHIMTIVFALLIKFGPFENNHQNKMDVGLTKSTTDELIEFKALLDAGVISQKEFDAKKKQLLGL